MDQVAAELAHDIALFGERRAGRGVIEGAGTEGVSHHLS